jgi:hypothetical protein
MVKFSFFAASLAAPGVLAGVLPGPQTQTENQLSPRQGGYYFQNWSEGGSNIRCNNGNGGSYTANWNSKGGFVCGKGWSYGGNRLVILCSSSDYPMLPSTLTTLLLSTGPSSTPEVTTPRGPATSASTAGPATP